MREVKSFCRFCMPFCGTRVTLDDDGHLVSVRGDKQDPMNHGYTCIKGVQAPATYSAPDRILTPIKRAEDGSFHPIDVEQALDEIAERLRVIIDRHGGESVGAFRGSGGSINASAVPILPALLESIGSHKFFTTMTIDQSAKVVTVERLGRWGAPSHPIRDSDIRLLVGVNPLVGMASVGVDLTNPGKTLKDAKARGMKLIVIDPRKTETARLADIFLQPYPGEDPTIMAGLIHIILAEGWEDKDFCARHVAGMDTLAAMVAPFDPDYVASRAGVSTSDLHATAALFARDSKRGTASTGTGPSMAPHSNLAEHLVEILNVICGRFQRAGEQVPNPGFLRPRYPRRAQVVAPARNWENGFRSRVGNYGMLAGEMMSGILCDEILQPGDGQIRALFVHGANLASVMPDQQKTIRAIKSLDIMVAIEPFMNDTARMSDYVFPGKLGYERADLTIFKYESLYSRPYARYGAPIASPPENSQLVDDWEVFWGLAKRLGLPLEYDGVALDMSEKPTTDSLLAIIARHAPMSWEDFKNCELGAFAEEPQYVEPGDPDAPDRFAVAPADIVDELREVRETAPEHGRYRSEGKHYTHLMVSRRLPEVVNSCHRNVPAIRKRVPQNFAYLHPDELARLGVVAGDMVSLTSDHGSIPAAVAPDTTLRRGIVSIAHGWGSLPGETIYERDGSNTGLLISTDRNLETINAQPRMSAVPVNIAAAPQHTRTSSKRLESL